MDNPIRRRSLVPPLATYHDYFVRYNTDNFRGHYFSILHPFQINMSNPAANPEEVSWKIYAAAQEVIPTAFF